MLSYFDSIYVIFYLRIVLSRERVSIYFYLTFNWYVRDYIWSDIWSFLLFSSVKRLWLSSRRCWSLVHFSSAFYSSQFFEFNLLMHDESSLASSFIFYLSWLVTSFFLASQITYTSFMFCCDFYSDMIVCSFIFLISYLKIFVCYLCADDCCYNAVLAYSRRFTLSYRCLIVSVLVLSSSSKTLFYSSRVLFLRASSEIVFWIPCTSLTTFFFFSSNILIF